MYSLPDEKMIKYYVWNGTIPDTNNWLVKEIGGGINKLVNSIGGGIFLV
jgi:hypothetical protein